MFFVAIQRFEVRIFVKKHENPRNLKFRKSTSGCILVLLFFVFFTFQMAVKLQNIIKYIRSCYLKPSPNSELYNSKEIMIIRHLEMKMLQEKYRKRKQSLKMHPEVDFPNFKICGFSWFLTNIFISHRCKVTKHHRIHTF